MDENETNTRETIARIGTFLILLGVFFFILFIATDAAGQPEFDYLFFGMLGIGFGVLLWRRRPPTAPSGRFGAIRKMRENAKKRREEKTKKEQKK